MKAFLYKHRGAFVALITAFGILGVRYLVGLGGDMVGLRPIVDVWLRVALLFFVLALGGIYWLVRDDTLREYGIVGVVSIFFVTVVLLLLRNTPYSFGGAKGDPGFHIAYITKFISTTKFVDFYYKDLPSFYPPLYFYLLGKLAFLLHFPSYAMPKIGLVLVMYGLPFILYLFWKHIDGGTVAVAIALFVMFMFHTWVKPSDDLSMLVFIPWWLYFVDNVARAKYTLRFVVIGGIIGSLIFQTFYYWFFVGGISLFVHEFLSKIVTNSQRGKSVKTLLKKAGILLSTAFFSSYYWLPFIISMYRTHGWQQLQARDFSLSNVDLALPMFSFDLLGICFLLGFFYLLYSFRFDQVSRGLLSLLASTYLLMIVGFAAVLLDNPIKANIGMRMVPILLLVSFLRGVIAHWDRVINFARQFRIGEALVGVVVLSAILYVGQGSVNDVAAQESLQIALDTKYPEQFLDLFAKVSGNEYADKVALMDNSYGGVVTYLPVYAFVALNAHYSHPAGLFYDRMEFLQKLANLEQPVLLAAAVMNNRFDKIDYILLEPEGDLFRYKYVDDAFPNGWESKSIYFHQSVFQEPYFDVVVDDYFYYVRQDFVAILPNYSANPIEDLEKVAQGQDASFSGINGDQARKFFADFGPYLIVGSGQER